MPRPRLAVRGLSLMPLSRYSGEVLEPEHLPLPTLLLPFAASLLVTATSASAVDAPRARLVYERSPEASSCPDDEVLRDAVRARRGYDPFDQNAERVLTASLERVGEALRARLVMSSPDEEPAERELSSQQADCAELASALARAIGRAIDPLSTPPAPEPSPPSPPTAPDPEPTPTAPAPTPEPVQPPVTLPPDPNPAWVVFGVVGVLGSAGALPSSALGFEAGMGIRRAPLSLALEGRADLPASKSVADGSISAGLITGSLVPCYRLGPVDACGLVSAGALRASAHDIAEAQQRTRFYAELGARAGIGLPVHESVGLRLHVDVAIPLVRHTLAIEDEPVWTSTTVVGALGVGVELR